MSNPRCFICNAEMSFFFQKESYNLYGSLLPSTKHIIPAEFFKCPECGLVTSKTHAELSKNIWNELNHEFHHFLESNNTNVVKNNQPPYAEQALMIALLIKNNIIEEGEILDYAAGYGTLRSMLKKYFNQEIKSYDKYINNNSQSYINEPVRKGYALVINSAMFEHITSRRHLDEVCDFVSETGCLMVHTLVPENVPNDPDWFYLDIPVHTTTHTNKSMALLMNQWGFKCSIYSPKSKSWVLMKKTYQEIAPLIAKINDELQTDWFYCKESFVDYWK